MKLAVVIQIIQALSKLAFRAYQRGEDNVSSEDVDAAFAEADETDEIVMAIYEKAKEKVDGS
jgi:hypothetical protein